MKTILKISLICWGIVGAFFLFFAVAPTSSPVATAIFFMLSGSAFLALFLFRYHRLKKEGADFGFFLARQKGYRFLLSGFVGAALFLIAAAWLIIPQYVENFLEKAAMPVAKFLVLLFWFSLIFAFTGFALEIFSESAVCFRLKKFKRGIRAFGVALVWLLFATFFCSLFLDVINDNFLQLSAKTKSYTLISFFLVIVLIGLCAGWNRDLKSFSREKKNVEDKKKTSKK